MFEPSLHRPAPRLTGAPGAVPVPEPEGYPAPAVVDLGQVLRAVRHRRWLVLACTVLATAGALYAARTRTPTYAATAVIRLSDARRSIAGDLADPTLRADNPTTDPIRSEMEILRSRAVAGRVVDREDAALLRVRPVGFPAHLLDGVRLDPAARGGTIELDFDAAGVTAAADGTVRRAAYGTPLEIAGVRLTVTAAPDVGSGQLQVLSRERAIGALVGGSSTRPRESTNIVDVTFTATDPHVAQLGANLLVAEYQHANLDAVRQRSLRRREFLEQQLAQAAVHAEAARDSLADFRSRRSTRTAREPAGQGDVAAVVARRDQALADRARYERLLRELDGGDVRDARITLVGTSEPNAVVADLAGQLARLVATRDSLTTGPWARAATHPDIVRLDTLVVRTRERLAEAVRGHLDLLGGRVAELGRTIGRGTTQLGELPTADAAESRLAERQETYLQVTRQLREEYQRAQIAEAVEAGDVELVDEAPVPGRRAGTAEWRIVALGLLLGMGTGVTVAFGAEQVHRTMRRREDVESYLGVPSLAIIPMVRGDGRRARLGRLLSRTPDADRGSRLIEAGPGVEDRLPEEAFRTLRTNLLFSDSGRAARTIAVTSSRVGEGKTTVCANLALSMARQGLRVLLVDGDLRRPRLHASFKLPGTPGLADVIGGTVAALDAVRPTAYPNVHLLPAGRAMPQALELFGVMPMREVLAGLSRDFDLIIVDTPPTLAASDATVVAAISDAVVFVVRAGSTSQQEGRRALQQLERVGARILGAVLNDRDRSSLGHDSYYSDVGSYVMEDGAARG